MCFFHILVVHSRIIKYFPFKLNCYTEKAKLFLYKFEMRDNHSFVGVFFMSLLLWFLFSYFCLHIQYMCYPKVHIK